VTIVETRERLEREREGLTAKLMVGGHVMYVTANTYPDGRLGEVFVKGAGKEGSTLQGVTDDLAKMLSIALQSHADLAVLARKLTDSSYPPNGDVVFNDGTPLGHADSLFGAVMLWIVRNWGDDALRAELGVTA
jgi:hypothetical protein